MIAAVTQRITKRMAGEHYDADVMQELSQMVLDRICLRIGVDEEAFPSILQSVVVDATIKAWRRRYYEGIATEKAGGITDEFVQDILAEYAEELNRWIQSHTDDSTAGKVVRFL